MSRGKAESPNAKGARKAHDLVVFVSRRHRSRNDQDLGFPIGNRSVDLPLDSRDLASILPKNSLTRVPGANINSAMLRQAPTGLAASNEPINIVWRDRVDVPSECTIVKTIKRISGKQA
jgi:hypothetical protein